jgi:hypothetical protein
MSMSNHQDDSRPPPAGSRSLREGEKPLWEPREAFANEKNRSGSLAKPSQTGKIDSAASRSLREREKSLRQPREAFANGKNRFGSLAKPSRAPERLKTTEIFHFLIKKPTL